MVVSISPVQTLIRGVVRCIPIIVSRKGGRVAAIGVVTVRVVTVRVVVVRVVIIVFNERVSRGQGRQAITAIQ